MQSTHIDRKHTGARQSRVGERDYKQVLRKLWGCDRYINYLNCIIIYTYSKCYQTVKLVKKKNSSYQE